MQTGIKLRTFKKLLGFKMSDSVYDTTEYTRIDSYTQLPPLLNRTTMSSLFRSEEMALCQLFIQPEAAYSTISELGEYGIVQFRDLNEKINSFQRKFAAEVVRCDELERQLRYIETEIKKDEVQMPEPEELPRAPFPREMINIEAHLEKTENDIVELSQNARKLKTSYLELIEMQHVLEKSQQFFDEHGGTTAAIERKRHESVISRSQWDLIDDKGNGRLVFVAGVVERERVPAFERMLWRISRGNVFLRQVPITKPFEDPVTGNKIFKTVFVAFFQGEQLKSRVLKVCTGFRASLYPVPELEKERAEVLMNIKTRIQDLTTILNQTEDHRQRVLFSVAKELQNWMVMVHKMKAIYHTLNMFNDDVTKKCLIGECWVPVNDIETLQHTLMVGSNVSGSAISSFLNVIETNEVPPTFNRTNKFTQGFQNLIDAYGIATYREANPALYTIITFPFLFAVMFGDMGHGLVVFLFGLFLVLKEKSLATKKWGEIFGLFFSGRYIIMLMGIFAVYTGFIYNDIFSRSINLGGTSWSNYWALEDINASKASLLIAPKEGFSGRAYIFGIDPIWQVSENKILFLNSFKMKMSIIIAIVHMMFGIGVSVVNIVHWKKLSEILTEFIPHIIFLSCTIAYLVFLVLYKWFLYSGLNEEPYTPKCAPSILIMFIAMILMKEPVEVEGCNDYMYSGQGTVETVLLFLALLAVPWMLCAKPIWTNRGKKEEKELLSVQEEGGEENQEEVNSGDEWIYSGIHTIEFCLNTISHTASYLRLWALSLAHAQLSDVLWKLLQIGFNMSVGTGGVVIFLIFIPWCLLTFGILILMEGLSAFLHTLRLHWVEFMSKFYHGGGYAFEPFSFNATLKTLEEE